MGDLVVMLKMQTNKKAVKKSQVHGKPSAKAEFVVGPGAPFKRRHQPPSGVSTAPAPTLAGGHVVTTSAAKQEGRKELREVEMMLPNTQDKTGSPPTVDVDEKTLADHHYYPIGQQQRQVISELLVKGAKLRDKMVDSLTTGSQRLQDHLKLR